MVRRDQTSSDKPLKLERLRRGRKSKRLEEEDILCCKSSVALLEDSLEFSSCVVVWSEDVLELVSFGGSFSHAQTGLKPGRRQKATSKKKRWTTSEVSPSHLHCLVR